MPAPAVEPADLDLGAALAALYAGGTDKPPRVLDVRPRACFLARRLAGAVSVPAPDARALAPRCFLLPDKAVPLALVAPREALPGVAGFLDDRGWAAGPRLPDCAELWAAAAALGVLEEGPGADGGALLARRALFEPSPLLAAAAAQLEALCAAERSSRPRAAPGAAAAAAPVPGQVVDLRALDVGCGSGRDLAWLAGRQPLVALAGGGAQPVRVRWHVTGVDSWHGALERAHELAAAMELTPAQVGLVYARVCPRSGALQLQRLPGASALRGAGRHASVVHAGGALPPAQAGAEARAAAPGQSAAGGSTRSRRSGTFVDGPGLAAFGRPSGHEHVLQPGELARWFGPAAGFDVLRDEVAPAPDGRELSYFVARKRAAAAASDGPSS
ncbi:SPAC2E11.09 [Scenedesmus sp. PABB004]|nr:SPAC2E11.09 [Scenedesmus sp. PABB004]